MNSTQRADVEAIINAIGEISKTEALNAIDRIIDSDGNQAAAQSSGNNRGSDSAKEETHKFPPSPEGGRAFRQQVIEVAASHDQTAHVRELRPDITIPIALAAARFALQQAREQIAACPAKTCWETIDNLLAQLASSAVPVREQQEQIETDQGAGLIGQTIPDVAETEPRPLFEQGWLAAATWLEERGRCDAATCLREGVKRGDAFRG